jgi:hypothetical protein
MNMTWVKSPIRNTPRRTYRGKDQNKRQNVQEWNAVSSKVVSYIDNWMENTSERVCIFHPYEIAPKIGEPLKIVEEVIAEMDGGYGVTCYNGDYDSAVRWFNPVA